MPEVNVEIAGRSYRVGCEEGEQEHLLGLAERINAEAKQLGRSMGKMSESRLLLMSALMIADRCAEAEARAEASAETARIAAEAAEAAREAAATDPAPEPQPDAEPKPRSQPERIRSSKSPQPGLFDNDLEDAIAEAMEIAAERLNTLSESLESEA